MPPELLEMIEDGYTIDQILAMYPDSIGLLAKRVRELEDVEEVQAKRIRDLEAENSLQVQSLNERMGRIKGLMDASDSLRIKTKQKHKRIAELEGCLEESRKRTRRAEHELARVRTNVRQALAIEPRQANWVTSDKPFDPQEHGQQLWQNAWTHSMKSWGPVRVPPKWFYIPKPDSRDLVPYVNKECLVELSGHDALLRGTLLKNTLASTGLVFQDQTGNLYTSRGINRFWTPQEHKGLQIKWATTAEVATKVTREHLGWQLTFLTSVGHCRTGTIEEGQSGLEVRTPQGVWPAERVTPLWATPPK